MDAQGPRTMLTTPAELPVLRSRHLLLRQPVPDDVLARLAVPPDPEAHRMYGGSGQPPPLIPAEVEVSAVAHAQQDLSQTRRFTIAALIEPDGTPIEEPDGRNIGGIRLDRIDWQDRRAALAIGIFDRRFWSHGYGSEAIGLLLGYAFDTLNLHRIGLRVLEYNLRAIRAYEKCGFVWEGIERESAYVDGCWHNDLIMGLLASEYHARAAQSPNGR